jgi:hypothetical protein
VYFHTNISKNLKFFSFIFIMALLAVLQTLEFDEKAGSATLLRYDTSVVWTCG